MKNHYFVHYWRDFGNCYDLYHAPADFVPPSGWERITRKEAERLARAEKLHFPTLPMHISSRTIGTAKKRIFSGVLHVAKSKSTA